MTAPTDRQVRLRLMRVGLLDLAKYGLLVGVVVAVITIIVVYIGWTAFSQAGGLQGIDATLSGGGGSSLSSITKVVNTGSVMSAALVLATAQIIGTIISFVVGGLAYNAASHFVGGLFVGFASRRA